MKVLIGLWRFLSLPIFVCGILLVWFGAKQWPAWRAASHPLPTQELLGRTAGTAYFRDSLRVDLRSSGLRLENVMGVELGPHIICVARNDSDTTLPARFVVESKRPEYLGPVLRLLEKADDAGQGKSSSTLKDLPGTSDISTRAKMQVLADKYQNWLDSPALRTELLNGVAVYRSKEEFPELEGLAPQVWLIQLGPGPSDSRVLGQILGGASLLVLFGFLQWRTSVWQRLREEEDLLEDEKPLFP